MSDETKRLKDEEQSNWEWEFEAENSDVLKADEAPSSNNFGESDEAPTYHPALKFLVIALGVGFVVFSSLNAGFSFDGLQLSATIRRFWWMIFFIPMLTRTNSPNWVGLACLFVLFSGVLGGMWWLIFLVPMFMNKQSRSC